MTSLDRHRRRVACNLARIGAALAAAMLVLGIADPMISGRAAVAAAPVNGGTLQVLAPSATGVGAALTSGSGSTAFVLAPPPSASCSGDSQVGYRAQSYIVPASIDPTTITFGSTPTPPIGTGAALRQPLYDTNGTAWENQTVGIGDGLVLGLPTSPFDFKVYGLSAVQDVPPGTYNVGIACSGPTPSALDKYWNVQLTFSADPTDLVTGIKWVTAAPTTTTTTSTTTTSTISTTTTTTVPSASTTTTSTAPKSSTSTTAVPVSGTSTTLVASLGTSSSSRGSSSPSLARTGWPSGWFVMWAVLLIAFGRIAVLLGRRPRVLPPGQS